MNFFKKIFGEEEVKDTDAQAEESDKFTRYWFAQLEKAREREKTYRKKAKDVVKLYEPEDENKVPFNILFSNTETLLPALYNNTPRPVVNRRYKTPDQLATISAKVIESVLTYQIDTDGRDYTSFDELIKYAVLQALVPGRGIVWYKYHPTFEKSVDEQGQEYDVLTAEQVCAEEVSWDAFLSGYGLTWETTPWIARIRYMSPAEVKKNFGDVEVKYDTAAEDGDKDNPRPEESKKANLATVYEIWDKVSKKVIFLAEGNKAPLKVVDDPLKLSGFFPCPKPLRFYERVTGQIPIPLYESYKNQADELNKVTKRISKLTEMLKVRGFYNASVVGIENVLSSEEGSLIPADNVAAMEQGQNLDNAIWLFPLQEIIQTLQQLHIQRENIKRTIYEITGIADIMRGSSVASETLGAQEIKNQWGTMRLKRMQKTVMMFVRECLRITTEIASMQFSPETFAKMTGYDLPTNEMKQNLQMQAQNFAQQGVQVPPEAQQQLEQFLKAPSWEDVVAFLRDDPMRQYQIDIETNSTVDIEATEDKAQVGEFLNAIAQFLNGIQPIVQQGILPPDAAKAIMMAVTKRFRFGVEVEESLEKMVAPPPPQQEEQKQAAPQESPEVIALKAQTQAQQEQLKQQTLQMDAEYSKAEHAYRMEELAMKRQVLLAQAEKAASDLSKSKESPNANV